MTLALFVLVLYSGLVEGYLRAMERNVVDLEVGDIQVYAGGYLDRPSKFTTIDEVSALLGQLDDAGFPASARLLAGGLAGAGESSAGVSLRGVDVERDARVCRIGEAIERGEWLDPDDPHGVVIGRRLAKTLAVTTGDELVVITQAMDGGPTDDLYFVRGILQGVADQTDRRAVFMTEDAFRELMVFPSGAHQIIVRRPPGADLDLVAERVRALAPELDVRTWKQLMPIVAQMLESTRGIIFFVLAIFYLAVGILILNSMLMSVFERIREFGVFKAIGGGPLRILGLILAESVIQIGVALAVGLGLSIPAMGYLSEHGINVGSLAGVSIAGVSMDPVWYGVYSSETVAGPVVMLVVFGLLAVLYPAVKAARIRPVEAMRYQ
jgi:ABC-type lipoprotein release transport system permease subunit